MMIMTAILHGHFLQVMHFNLLLKAVRVIAHGNYTSKKNHLYLFQYRKPEEKKIWLDLKVFCVQLCKHWSKC